MHKGEQLRALASHAERAALSLHWAEEARDAWYEGKARWVADGHEPTAWGKEFKAREFMGLEQMYSRWATMYATFVAAGINNSTVVE